MGHSLKQSTAYTRTFLMVDSSDHVTGKTGVSLSPDTLTVYISKAGGAFAVCTGARAEIAYGWYKITLGTGDTDTLGDLAFHITGAGCDPTDFVDQVTANILGDTLPANVTQVNAHAVTDTTNGILDVNAKNINNAAAPTIGSPAGASVSADIAAVKADTAAIGAAGAGLTALGDTRIAHLDADVSSRATAADVPSASTIATAVWNVLTSALSTVGSIGKLLADNIDAAISSRLATVGYTAPDNADIVAIKAKTDNLPSAPADETLIIAATDAIMTRIGVNGAGLTSLGDTRIAHLDADISSIPTANANAAALLDLANGVETGITVRQAQRLQLAALAGKASGLATLTAKYRDVNDTKDRITATVDADGNRSAVTLDAT